MHHGHENVRPHDSQCRVDDFGSLGVSQTERVLLDREDQGKRENPTKGELQDIWTGTRSKALESQMPKFSDLFYGETLLTCAHKIMHGVMERPTKAQRRLLLDRAEKVCNPQQLFMVKYALG